MARARLAAMAVLLLAACSADRGHPAPPPPLGNTQQAHEVTKPMQGRLAQLQALLGTDQQAFIDRFGIQPEHIRSDAAYEGLKDVTEIHRPDHAELGPARFFFRDGRLALIYLSDPAAIPAPEIDAIKSDPSAKGTVLRSRAGKTSNLHVYAEKGVAISMGKQIDFIELFQPTTPQQYEQAIYVPIGPFKL
jgi:hypothetical protein